MAGEYHTHPKSEKALVLIDYCIDRQGVTVSEVAELFECHKKTARRLMTRMSDMSHELSYLDADFKGGKIFIKLVDMK